MLIKQESVQSTFTNVSSSSLNRAVAQFIDVTVYRLQGAIVGHITKIDGIMNNSLSYREQRIAGELFPQYATELLFFLFETGRHDKQHTFTKGSQGYFSLKRQYIINFIVESEIENVFIEQRPPITQLMRKESFLHNPMIFSYEPNFFNLVTRFATAFLDSPLTTDCSGIYT